MTITMSQSYQVPAERTRCELTVKGSRFIATVDRVKTAEEANAFISAVKKEFSDASHNCSAYLSAGPGDTNSIGMSDDGEPSGTAGRPMLTTILHSGVGEIAVVVTRYFGGTKLGKGGLVRAYTNAVKDVLEKLPVKEFRLRKPLLLRCDYSDLEKTKSLIWRFKGEIARIDYASDVEIRIRVPEEDIDKFTEEFRQATCGRGDIKGTK